MNLKYSATFELYMDSPKNIKSDGISYTHKSSFYFPPESTLLLIRSSVFEIKEGMSFSENPAMNPQTMSL